jgi:hypothetical protein
MKIRRISSSEKEENELMTTINVCSLKTQELCGSWWWLKKDQQGLGRDEPYIGEEQVEDLVSRYRMWWRRGKWMFESTISIMPFRATKL